MQLLHPLRTALLGADRGDKRNKADIADAPTRNLSERDDGVHEEGPGAAQEEDHDEPQNHSSSVIGPFLTPRTRSPSPSRSPSEIGSHHPSDLPPSEYNLIDSQKKSKWSTTRKFRHSRACWITVFALTMVSVATILATVLIFTRHAHKASASTEVDFTVDLGYSKYTGISAADDEIVKWLGIRYAAPPVGDLRFRAPQDPLANDTVQLADTVCFTFPLGIFLTDRYSMAMSVSQPLQPVSNLASRKTVSSSMSTRHSTTPTCILSTCSFKVGDSTQTQARI
jgi:hypothetical protein